MNQKKLRVLLAEAGFSETATALRALHPGREGRLELTMVSSIATLLPTIKVVDPEVILLDLTLNLREPFDAVHLVHRTAPGVPLIVIADADLKEQAAKTLTQGAMDYLLKGFIDTRTLDRALRSALERNTMHALTDMMRDPVTSLYTRDGFLTVGSRRLDEAHHNNSSLVLICALFENLQTLREGFGPGAADHALCDLATLMKASCRRSDVVARLGEAQFAVLGVDAIAPSAEIMRARLEQRLIVHNRTRSPWGPVELRTSTGSWSGNDPRSFPEFLDSVETQLRLAPVGAQGKP
jgi:two-component system, cell cycle response regulator